MFKYFANIGRTQTLASAVRYEHQENCELRPIGI
jgi:hypothetical protein